MGDKKVVAIVIFLLSLVVSIPLVIVNTYFTNKGYDYQSAKFNTGMILFYLGIPSAFGYNIYLKIKHRKNKHYLFFAID